MKFQVENYLYNWIYNIRKLKVVHQ